MNTTLRTALTAVAISLLSLGYVASQMAFFSGHFSEHASRVDQAPVAITAGLFLALAIALAVFRVRPED